MSSRRIGLVAAGVLVLALAAFFGVRALGGSSSAKSTASPAVTPAASAVAGADTGPSAGSATTAGPASRGTIPTSGTTSVGNADAVVAACNVSPSKLKVLTSVSRDDSALENLRDGIPLLDERIEMLQEAAQGRPVLNAVLEHTQQLRADWNAALEAHDDGQPAAAARQMSAAKHQIALIDTLLTSSADLPASTCA